MLTASQICFAEVCPIPVIYVKAMGTRFDVGIFTPAIRATFCSFRCGSVVPEPFFTTKPLVGPRAKADQVIAHDAPVILQREFAVKKNFTIRQGVSEIIQQMRLFVTRTKAIAKTPANDIISTNKIIVTPESYT